MSGLNDTYMVPGNDSMIDSWLSQFGSYRLIKPGPDTSPPFWDVIAGFHNAPSGDPLAGKGNCALLDGHVEGYSRLDTFPLAWPHSFGRIHRGLENVCHETLECLHRCGFSQSDKGPGLASVNRAKILGGKAHFPRRRRYFSRLWPKSYSWVHYIIDKFVVQ